MKQFPGSGPRKFSGSGQTRTPGSGNQRNFNSNNNKVKSWNTNGYQNGSSKPTRGRRGGGRGGRPFSSANMTPIGPKCSLCGYGGHIPLVCPNMQNDQGRKITVAPTLEPCTKCPKGVGPLRHPERNCPYRPKGPWANRNQSTKKD